MKNSSRRQVRTPVGNKIKRGAELESTPKTPRSFEASPCNSTCVDSFSQQPEVRRSRKALEWNNLAKQGMNTMAQDSLQTTLCSLQHQDLTSTRESLSPICMNALRGNTDQHGGWTPALKKLKEMPPSYASPRTMDCHAALKRNGVLEDVHRNASGDHSKAEPGVCLSSSESRISRLSEEPILFWSNAAFNQGLAHEETVCISKDTASSSSCSSSRASSHYKAAILVQADCKAESKATDHNSLSRIDGSQILNGNGRQTITIVGATAANTKNGTGSSEYPGPEDKETKPGGSRGEIAESTLARKLLFENDESSLCALVLEQDYGVCPYVSQQRADTKEHKDLQTSVTQFSQAAKDEEERHDVGLDKIEQEIQRLTERLTELQLQKRMWGKKMRRHREENNKKAESTFQVGRKDTVAILQRCQCKRLLVNGAKRGKGAVISMSSSSAPVLQSPVAQSLRTYHEVVSKVQEESPLASVIRQVKCPSNGSVGKLSELRSSASRRKESSGRSSDAEADCSKVMRWLSVSGAVLSTASNVQGQQQRQRSRGSCTSSRVVSSRYGRAITLGAHRSSHKKENRSSLAASLPLLQPPASEACSPLKKIATLRSGYPSPSGFATPTKERQQHKPLSSIRSAAVCPSSTTTAPSLSSSSLGRERLLHSPKKSPMTSADSTIALYKCLESLLEDCKASKHSPPAFLLSSPNTDL